MRHKSETIRKPIQDRSWQQVPWELEWMGGFQDKDTFPQREGLQVKGNTEEVRILEPLREELNLGNGN